MPYVSAEVDFEQAQEAKRKDARIAELTICLRDLADAYEDAAITPEHSFAYRQARAALAAVGGKKP